MPAAARQRRPAWRDLRPFDHVISGDDQVLLVAATGGSKSTLVASMTLRVPNLVALDEKDALRLPNSRIVDLPPYGETIARDPAGYLALVRKAIAYRESRPGQPAETNRVILRVNVLDLDDMDAHNEIFHAVYERRAVILWIDEITATGATAQRVQKWLRGISARGRTRHIGLWTCTQAPFGLTPPILRRNANYLIFGPIDSEDVGDIKRSKIEIVETIPRKSGRFIVYVAGEREPYRLYLPIPDALAGWRAP